jgi:glycosyltransferase involved in cell wall biosynthesis
MKILIVLPGKYFKDRIGGSVSHTIGVIDAMIDSGHEVFFCSSDKIPYYDREIKYSLLKVKELNLPKFNRVYRDFSIYIQLKDIIKHVKPDVVYIRWRQNIFWGRLFGGRNYKIVFECNTPPTMSLQYNSCRSGKIIKKLTRTLDKKICIYSDLVSAVSDTVRNFLVEEVGCDENKIIVNPNGVDTRRFSPEGNNHRDKYGIGTDNIVIGYTGLFRPQHGIEILIKAFKDLNKEQSGRLRLIIIGSGENDYERKLKNMAIDDKDIIFTGKVPFNSMPSYLRTCDIMVSPQIPLNGEIFHQSPIKLYEYMAAGRPVIASNIGQMNDVINDGFNGLLFESGNIKSLSNRLAELISDYNLRKALSENARREAVELYSWKNNIKRITGRLYIKN